MAFTIEHHSDLTEDTLNWRLGLNSPTNTTTLVALLSTAEVTWTDSVATLVAGELDTATYPWYTRINAKPASGTPTLNAPERAWEFSWENLIWTITGGNSVTFRSVILLRNGSLTVGNTTGRGYLFGNYSAPVQMFSSVSFSPEDAQESQQVVLT